MEDPGVSAFPQSRVPATAPDLALPVNPPATPSEEGISENLSSVAPCSLGEGEERREGWKSPLGEAQQSHSFVFTSKELPTGRLASLLQDSHLGTGQDVPIVAPHGHVGIAVLLPWAGCCGAAPMPRVGV